jgi:hypothetical protein
MVAAVTAEGYEEVAQEEVAERFTALVEQRGLGSAQGGGAS